LSKQEAFELELAEMKPFEGLRLNANYMKSLDL
jgi:hypothetical protein